MLRWGCINRMSNLTLDPTIFGTNKLLTKKVRTREEMFWERTKMSGVRSIMLGWGCIIRMSNLTQVLIFRIKFNLSCDCCCGGPGVFSWY